MMVSKKAPKGAEKSTPMSANAPGKQSQDRKVASLRQLYPDLDEDVIFQALDESNWDDTAAANKLGDGFTPWEKTGKKPLPVKKEPVRAVARGEGRAERGRGATRGGRGGRRREAGTPVMHCTGTKPQPPPGGTVVATSQPPVSRSSAPVGASWASVASRKPELQADEFQQTTSYEAPEHNNVWSEQEAHVLPEGDSWGESVEEDLHPSPEEAEPAIADVQDEPDLEPEQDLEDQALDEQNVGIDRGAEYDSEILPHSTTGVVSPVKQAAQPQRQAATAYRPPQAKKDQHLASADVPFRGRLGRAAFGAPGTKEVQLVGTMAAITPDDDIIFGALNIDDEEPLDVIGDKAEVLPPLHAPTQASAPMHQQDIYHGQELEPLAPGTSDSLDGSGHAQSQYDASGHGFADQTQPPMLQHFVDPMHQQQQHHQMYSPMMQQQVMAGQGAGYDSYGLPGVFQQMQQQQQSQFQGSRGASKGAHQTVPQGIGMGYNKAFGNQSGPNTANKFGNANMGGAQAQGQMPQAQLQQLVAQVAPTAGGNGSQSGSKKSGQNINANAVNPVAQQQGGFNPQQQQVYSQGMYVYPQNIYQQMPAYLNQQGTAGNMGPYLMAPYVQGQQQGGGNNYYPTQQQNFMYMRHQTPQQNVTQAAAAAAALQQQGGVGVGQQQGGHGGLQPGLYDHQGQGHGQGANAGNAAGSFEGHGYDKAAVGQLGAGGYPLQAPHFWPQNQQAGAVMDNSQDKFGGNPSNGGVSVGAAGQAKSGVANSQMTKRFAENYNQAPQYQQYQQQGYNQNYNQYSQQQHVQQHQQQ